MLTDVVRMVQAVARVVSFALRNPTGAVHRAKAVARVASDAQRMPEGAERRVAVVARTVSDERSILSGAERRGSGRSRRRKATGRGRDRVERTRSFFTDAYRIDAHQGLRSKGAMTLEPRAEPP